MAFLPPILAAAGSAATTAAPFLAAGTSLLQFNQRRQAGKLAEKNAEIAASQEELGAVQRESDRKRRLAETLATQMASTGAKGISTFEGSPLTILEEDISREEQATQRDVFQTKLSAMTKKAAGEIKKEQTRAGAATSLLTDLVDIAPTFPTGKKKTGKK